MCAESDKFSKYCDVGQEERSYGGAGLHIQTAEQGGRALEDEGEV